LGDYSRQFVFRSGTMLLNQVERSILVHFGLIWGTIGRSQWGFPISFEHFDNLGRRLSALLDFI